MTLNKDIGLQPILDGVEDICLFATLLRLQCLAQPDFQTWIMKMLFGKVKPSLKEQLHINSRDLILLNIGYAFGINPNNSNNPNNPNKPNNPNNPNR